MTDPLFWARPEDIAAARPGSLVRVSGDEGRHGALVRRLRPGEPVLLADGAGHGIRGPVRALGRELLEVEVAELLEAPAQALEVTAVQALAKGERSDIAIEAMTELGVSTIIAWQASRSVVRWTGKTEKGLARWRSVAARAAKQSRRLRIPRVWAAGTDELPGILAGADLALVLHEQAARPLSELTVPASGRVVMVIGPEGGIAPDELDRCTAAGAEPVLLSDAVLRTSTAGVVALAQLQALAGR